VDRAVSDLPLAAAVVIGAYFVGSIPIGLLFARRRGIEIRDVGSGNIGAANVARNLGKKLGAVVLVLDAVKGAVPLVVVRLLELDQTVDPFVITATGFAAVAGHCFPIWLRFDGGKGVATSLGAYLALDPLVTAVAVAVFVLLYLPFRIVSVGSLVAAASYPVFQLLFGRSDAEVTLGIAIALIVVYRHRDNIARLRQRREHRI
jgi:glycerol-3-phosphate acyltransferase PlsY